MRKNPPTVQFTTSQPEVWTKELENGEKIGTTNKAGNLYCGFFFKLTECRFKKIRETKLFRSFSKLRWRYNCNEILPDTAGCPSYGCFGVVKDGKNGFAGQVLPVQATEGTGTTTKLFLSRGCGLIKNVGKRRRLGAALSLFITTWSFEA